MNVGTNFFSASESQPATSTAVKPRMLTADDLRSGNVLLAYQPVIDSKNGEVVFFEGLARLHLASGETLPAGAFIHRLRHSSLGRELDEAVLTRLVADLSVIPRFRFSINVPVNSMVNRDWRDRFDLALAEVPDLSGRLIVEIDEESTLAMPDFISDFMREYQARGVLFALDNFGRAHSSIRNLTDFHFDVLKVDGFFVEGLERSPDKSILMKILISIANELDVLLIAEKVESKEEASALVRMGVRLLQGTAIGNPIYPGLLRHAYLRAGAG